jgi:hypothetical protein
VNDLMKVIVEALNPVTECAERGIGVFLANYFNDYQAMLAIRAACSLSWLHACGAVLIIIEYQKSDQINRVYLF